MLLQTAAQALVQAVPQTTVAHSSFTDTLFTSFRESFSMILTEFRPRVLTRAAVHDVGFTLHEAFAYTNTWLE